MVEIPDQYADDYSDLTFDIARHGEAFGAFAALNIEKKSVKLALKARDLVRYEGPSGKFLIGIGDDRVPSDEIMKSDNFVAFEVIYVAQDAGEANAVRADVARYFRRHFPGRCLNTVDGDEGSGVEGGSGAAGANCVTIAFFKPED